MINNKNCRIQIPIQIAKGYQIQLQPILISGFVALPANGTARVQMKYSVDGQSLVMADKLFKGPTQLNYNLANDLNLDSSLWTKCSDGTIKNYLIETKASVNTNEKKENSIISIDQFGDAKKAWIISFEIRKCI